MACSNSYDSVLLAPRIRRRLFARILPAKSQLVSVCLYDSALITSLTAFHEGTIAPSRSLTTEITPAIGHHSYTVT